MRFSCPEVRPRCHVCKRTVDRVDSWQEPHRMVFVFVFRCHGESERVELAEDEIEDAERIEVLDAFAPRALPGAWSVTVNQLPERTEEP